MAGTIYGLPSDGSIPRDLDPLKWESSRAFDVTAPPRRDDIPTLTWDASMSTALTTPVEYEPAIVGTGSKTAEWDGQSDANILFGPGVYESFHGGTSDLTVQGKIKPGGSSQAAGWPLIYSFQTSAVDTIELSYYGYTAGAGFSLMFEVNGRMVDDTIQRSQPMGGSGGKVSLKFPVARSRHVKVYGGHFPGLAAIRVPAGGTITKPATPARTAAVIGDSFANGSGNSDKYPDQGTWNVETFAPRLLRMLGYESTLLAGIGGTGYTTTNPYSERVPVVLSKSPDFLMLYGSVNDRNVPEATLQTAVEGVLESVATIPRVVVVPPGVSGYEMQARALRAAVTATGVGEFLDVGEFFYGTGKVTAKTGDGSNDYFLMNDGTHPTLDGHRAFARFLYGMLGGIPD